MKFWDSKMKKLHRLGLFREEAHGAVAHDLVALHLKALRKLDEPYRPTNFLEDLYSEVLASVRHMSLEGLAKAVRSRDRRGTHLRPVPDIPDLLRRAAKAVGVANQRRRRAAAGPSAPQPQPKEIR